MLLREKLYQRWLQTVFPAMLADRFISDFKRLSAGAKKNFGDGVKHLIRTGVFERPVWINDLWGADNSLTHQWLCVKPWNGGPYVRSVRCGLPFAAIIDREAPQPVAGRNVQGMFSTLLSKCVPHARDIFSGNFAPIRLLHMNDYVLEKTFVYAMIALSKWMGEERFPQGLYGNWPPEPPDDLHAAVAEVAAEVA